MSETFHIRASKDYAIPLLELLRKDGAIEDLELKQFELSESQKLAIDKELGLIDSDPSYLKKWDEVKKQFRGL